MKQKRKMVVFLLATLAAFFVYACSGNKSDTTSSENVESKQERYANDGMENGMADSAYDYEYDEATGAGEMDVPAEEGQAEEDQASFDRKIIKNANLEMEAKDANTLYGELTKYGNELGGYEYSFDVSNYETYSVIHAVYKIPPDKLNQLMDFAGETGKIINSTMSSEDITDNYYDTKTRLESKRKSLDQYYMLLQKAMTIEEITKIQTIIDQITEEIESSEGKLKMWNSLVDMATLELYIRQDNDPVKIKKEINWNTLSMGDMGYLIKRGLVSLLNTMISLFQWIVVAIIVISPIWIIIGIVLWIWFKKKKKRKDNDKAK